MNDLLFRYVAILIKLVKMAMFRYVRACVRVCVLGVLGLKIGYK